jgi:hypothetical protein
MHRIAERHAARASLIVLALALAFGAAMCVRVHRTVARSDAAAAGSAQAYAPSSGVEPAQR